MNTLERAQMEDGEAEEQLLDYSRLMPILHGAGFDGWLSIVYTPPHD